MSNKLDNSYYMKCPECGSKNMKASAEAKAKLCLWVYNNKVYAEIDDIDCDEYDLSDICCDDCGYNFAYSFIELQNEVKKSGDEDAK